MIHHPRLLTSYRAIAKFVHLQVAKNFGCHGEHNTQINHVIINYRGLVIIFYVITDALLLLYMHGV